MQINLKAFASIRDALKWNETAWVCPAGTTVGMAVEKLGEQYPQLFPFRNSLLIAVNQSYADPNYLLHDGDELALIPPVSGG